MKKILTSMLLIFTLAVACMTQALAASAPSWKSFFTSEKYNKTFTDKDGVHHEYKCYMVTEGWNEIGTIYYTIYYHDITTIKLSETDVKIDYGEKRDRKSYPNACPVYPNAPKYTYYAVKHYPDHDEVITDYRSGLPKTTPTPKATATPEATAKATTKPTIKPTSKPTTTATIKATATAKPTTSPMATVAPATFEATVTASPAATPTITATVIAGPTSPAPTATPSPEISATATVMPMATAIKTTTAMVTPAISATPTATDVPAAVPPTQQRPMSAILIGSVIVLPILGGVIYAVLRLRRTGRNNR